MYSCSAINNASTFSCRACLICSLPGSNPWCISCHINLCYLKLPLPSLFVRGHLKIFAYHTSGLHFDLLHFDLKQGGKATHTCKPSSGAPDSRRAWHRLCLFWENKDNTASNNQAQVDQVSCRFPSISFLQTRGISPRSSISARSQQRGWANTICTQIAKYSNRSAMTCTNSAIV